MHGATARTFQARAANAISPPANAILPPANAGWCTPAVLNHSNGCMLDVTRGSVSQGQAYYEHNNGQMRNGLSNCVFMLRPVGQGDGGFGVVPVGAPSPRSALLTSVCDSSVTRDGPAKSLGQETEGGGSGGQRRRGAVG